MALLNWDLARKLAHNISKRVPEPVEYNHQAVEQMFSELTPKAEELVKSATQLPASKNPARSKVVRRTDWIDANLTIFTRMLAPLEERLGHKVHSFSRNVGGFQVGVLLGWMSTRVLGQYDLLILNEDSDEDSASTALNEDQDLVYYVGPNIFALEWKHGFKAEDFRFWIALHELTHRAQFTGVEWLGRHFQNLVHEALSHVEFDTDRIKSALASFKERSQKDSSLPYLLGSEKQIEIFDQLGGMMSFLEGHGEVMMDAAAKDHISDVDRFHRVMRQRRTQTKGLAGILQKLMGIEAKLRQYEAGEKFVNALEQKGGISLVNRVLEEPENLPSMAEINAPETWLARVKPYEELTA